MFFMTPTILKNLFRKSATRMYPLETRDPFERARGELTIDISDCIFCKACERKCPSGCITVDNKAATWTLDPSACIYCGICVDACRKGCLSQKTMYRVPVTEKEIITVQGELKQKPKKESAEKKNLAA